MRIKITWTTVGLLTFLLDYSASMADSGTWQKYELKDLNCSFQSPYPLQDDQKLKFPLPRKRVRLVSPPEKKDFKICYQVVDYKSGGVIPRSYFKVPGRSFLRTVKKLDCSGLPAELADMPYVDSLGKKRKLQELTVESGKYWWRVLLDYSLERGENERMAQKFFDSLEIPHESFGSLLVRKYKGVMFSVFLSLLSVFPITMLSKKKDRVEGSEIKLLDPLTSLAFLAFCFFSFWARLKMFNLNFSKPRSTGSALPPSGFLYDHLFLNIVISALILAQIWYLIRRFGFPSVFLKSAGVLVWNVVISLMFVSFLMLLIISFLPFGG